MGGEEGGGELRGGEGGRGGGRGRIKRRGSGEGGGYTLKSIKLLSVPW